MFALDVARELQILLYGIDHASDEGAVRAALATRLYGLGFHTLKALREQPEAWLDYEQQFQQWRARWQREGVLAVVRALIEYGAPALLAGDDGERMLTDLRHLGERAGAVRAAARQRAAAGFLVRPPARWRGC